jgi:hypothetical protein
MNGERWLVDSGSGVYISSDLGDRNSFRGTAAHATVRVDGVDQAIPEEPFSWTRIPASHVDRWVAGHTFTFFAGSHDGYARLADAVTHQRSILRVNGYSAKGAAPSGVWLVRDVLLGDNAHELEIFWHFASDLMLKQQSMTEMIASRPESSKPGGPVLRMISPEQSEWRTEITSGRISPSYGRYENAPIARSAADVTLPAETATAMIAESSSATASLPVRMVHVPNAAAQVYELRIGDDVHTFIFGESKQLWSFGPWTMNWHS